MCLLRRGKGQFLFESAIKKSVEIRATFFPKRTNIFLQPFADKKLVTLTHSKISKNIKRQNILPICAATSYFEDDAKPIDSNRQ